MYLFFKASESWGFIPAAFVIYGYMVVLALHGPRHSPAGPKPQLLAGFSQVSHSFLTAESWGFPAARPGGRTREELVREGTPTSWKYLPNSTSLSRQP